LDDCAEATPETATATAIMAKLNLDIVSPVTEGRSR
jgi:hypothetical protein